MTREAKPGKVLVVFVVDPDNGWKKKPWAAELSEVPRAGARVIYYDADKPAHPARETYPSGQPSKNRAVWVVQEEITLIPDLNVYVVLVKEQESWRLRDRQHDLLEAAASALDLPEPRADLPKKRYDE